MEFYIGIKLFHLYKNQKKGTTSFTFPIYTVMGISGVALTLLLLSHLHDVYLAKTLVHIWALPIAIAVSFWGILTEDSLIRRLLETDLFQLLGKSSYAFYLLHMGFLQVLLYEFFNTDNTLILISVTLISIAVYKLIEEPLQKMITRRAYSWKKPKIAEQG